MTFGRYLRYRLKVSTIRTLAFTVISVAIIMLSVIEMNNNSFLWITNNESGIHLLAVLMGFLAFIIPMLETVCFKSRRNLDTLYSLPIKRKELALSHYLSGLIQLFTVYSVTFFTVLIYHAINTDWYDLSRFWLFYAISILFGWIFYSLIIFVFNAANTAIDGAIFSVFWIFAIPAVGFAVMCQLARFDVEIPVDALEWLLDGIVYYPFANLTYVIRNYCVETNERYFNPDRLASYDFTEEIIATAVWTLIAALATYGYFRNMQKKGAEQAGEISGSWLGYKLLSPLYGYSCIIIIGATASFSALWTALIVTAMAVGYIIMRRSFKLKSVDCIMLGIGVALSVLLSL